MSVLLADGGELRTPLSTEPGITVVAEAVTSRAVARETMLRCPDVVILDPELDQRGGIAMITELLRSAPDAAVLVCSASEEAGWVSAVMRAGARGYVVKGAEPDDVVRAIRGVAAGEVIFGAHVATKVTRMLSGNGGGSQAVGRLTGRERQVLDLIVAGLPNSAIARRLRLAQKTVRNNVSLIFGKLRVTSRAEAIAASRLTR